MSHHLYVVTGMPSLVCRHRLVLTGISSPVSPHQYTVTGKSIAPASSYRCHHRKSLPAEYIAQRLQYCFAHRHIIP